MNNIKTVADLKRAMTLGTVWECTHKYTNHPSEPKSLGIRKIVRVQTNRVGFETDRGTISWLDFPKKSELSTEDNGNIVVITNDFCQLRYIERN